MRCRKKKAGRYKNAQLLLPNPYRPGANGAFFSRTVSSNFIFGVLIGWLLSESDQIAQRVRAVHQVGATKAATLGATHSGFCICSK
jgi:hypothetical protein